MRMLSGVGGAVRHRRRSELLREDSERGGRGGTEAARKRGEEGGESDRGEVA
jgi:hypothetical protein